jgi:hypothetical protein
MKLNKQAIQKELDLAAEELEKCGYQDLAEQIDKCNSQLMQLEDDKHQEITAVKRTLSRISREAERRERVKNGKSEDEKSKEKAAIEKARRVSEVKKHLKVKRIKEEIAANKKQIVKDKKLENNNANVKVAKDKLRAKLEEYLDEKKLDRLAAKIAERMVEKAEKK